MCERLNVEEGCDISKDTIFTALLLRENHNFPSSGFQNKTSFLFETRQPRTHVRVLG